MNWLRRVYMFNPNVSLRSLAASYRLAFPMIVLYDDCACIGQNYAQQIRTFALYAQGFDCTDVNDTAPCASFDLIIEPVALLSLCQWNEHLP